MSKNEKSFINISLLKTKKIKFEGKPKKTTREDNRESRLTPSDKYFTVQNRYTSVIHYYILCITLKNTNYY